MRRFSGILVALVFAFPALAEDSPALRQLKSQIAFSLTPLDPYVDVANLNAAEASQLWLSIARREPFLRRRAAIRSVILRQERRLQAERQPSPKG